MLRLEHIKKDAVVEGLVPHEAVRILSAEPIGPDAVHVMFRTASGTLQEQTLFRSHEPSLRLAEAGLPWSFEAYGEDFKLAAEAYRIHVAHLFDPMMAVHTSNVQPLPHQITAVYESMLPRQPLRFVLADDPGAGKTIMAGLYIRELMIRADAVRILIIAPGSLVEQWQDELYEKFDLEFELFSREMEQLSRTGNPFEERDRLIARLDQLSRNDSLLEKLGRTRWDLVVVDEAHKMSASWYGNKVNETKRFKLGKLVGSITRHFLLMTATPHNGREEDFQLFLSLLDSDRFYGKFRDGAHQVDVSDLMRRMVKEELVKFDGTPLFPERRAETIYYELSDLEAALYQQVTEYVREEMNRADRLEVGRKGTVGFALTTLQRRLASSPEAIYQSLKRRRERLQRQLDEAKIEHRGRLAWVQLHDVPDDIYESDEELPGGEYEELEDEIASQATAAQTIAELEQEIRTLERLEALAYQLVLSNQDSKWTQLSTLLHDEPEMRDKSGNRRKLIIFTEHRDTLNYLQRKMEGFLGRPDAIVAIHGGTKRDERRKIQEKFWHDPDTLILLATDAAGEGVNLQNANLLINYDLPWNPNRLEQRFGRIHRIGQTEVCYMWNLVASKTREGEVFQRLFEKLKVEREALQGRVFDILGQVFEEKPLKELLIEAIRRGDDPEVRARLEREVDGALDREHLKAILERNALCEEVMSPERLYHVKEEMEKAEARRLHPYFIRAFFREAFARLGGELKERERERYEITHVPAVIRERDRQISGRDRGNRKPVLKRYERVCFERELVRVPHKPVAALLHTGHPLMQAVTDLTLERGRTALRQGAILVDDHDDSDRPYMLFLIEHAVREQPLGGQTRDVSRRVQFVAVYENGEVALKGYAPHLDLRGATDEERHLVREILRQPWLSGDLDALAQKHAIALIGGPHYQEIQERRNREVTRVRDEVHKRLSSEIQYWVDRHEKLKDDIAAGKQPRMQLENVRRIIEDLTARLEQRKRELEAMRHLISATPVVVGGALVIPAGFLTRLRGEAPSADVVSRARIERVAMEAVLEAERRMGHEVIDVSAAKCGWDITARIRKPDGTIAAERHIEVKGRAKGQDTITVTRNEMMYALNQGDKFLLAIVIVDGDRVDGPYYIRNPFRERPDWAEVSKTFDLRLLLERAVPVEQSL
ncbi:helicase-related protein [Alicyclobacillus acidocaldarius]|uniref:Helicase domain protein n=1 Tax=Alicyclobacillus acidocaldarius (strain Tc-4-1) TaxID=1048834 RepID=F8IGT2_ALIAT|nr:helicase-related protein [Alicyclobacillus acidocaldarius]AEJ43097.1 helicase domain protein [Alicyclobacillus acidocaldarius subsp. acidocaldarius Tc-4-1]